MPLVSARYQMLLTAKLIKKKTSVVIHCSFVRRVLSRLFRNKLISSILTLICSQNWCKLSHGQQFSFKPRCYHIHVFNFHAFSRFFTLKRPRRNIRQFRSKQYEYLSRATVYRNIYPCLYFERSFVIAFFTVRKSSGN